MDPMLVDGWENNAPGKGTGEHTAPLTVGLRQLGFGVKETSKQYETHVGRMS